jgi:hypothetical protein
MPQGDGKVNIGKVYSTIVHPTDFRNFISLFRIFFPLFLDHLNIIYHYTLEDVQPFLATFSAISTATFIRLHNHIVDLLRHVALHDYLVDSSRVFCDRTACRKSLGK